MANTNIANFPYAAPMDAGLHGLSVASDNAATTLSGDIDGVVTSIPVLAHSSFVVPCLIVIGNEIILAQSVNTNGFTQCLRGFAGTTNASHTSGSDVSGFIVAYHHNQVAKELEELGSYVFESNLSGFKTSQNMLTYSEDFSQTYWAKTSGVIVSAAVGTLPNGSPTTTMLEGTFNGLNKLSAVPVGLVDGNTYTLSVYAKYSNNDWIVIGQRLDGPENNYAWFDVSTGTCGTMGNGLNGAAIVPIGNGWYRCMVIITSSTTNAYKAFDIGLAPGDGISASYIGTATQAVTISGAQVQVGDLSGQMSYIKTNGTTFSLTGSGDLILDEGDLS